LMGGLLHLVQRGGDWAVPQPCPTSHIRCDTVITFALWRVNFRY